MILFGYSKNTLMPLTDRHYYGGISWYYPLWKLWLKVDEDRKKKMSSPKLEWIFGPRVPVSEDQKKVLRRKLRAILVQMKMGTK